MIGLLIGAMAPLCLQAAEAQTNGSDEDIAAATTEAAASAQESEELSEEERAAELLRQARVQELSRELEQRQQAISNQQSDLGIYHPGLIEQYSDLSKVYLELEDYESASGALNDALQIARINTGLYSEQQLPLLDELIASHLKGQEWQKVDDLVHLDHHISSRLYDTTDDQYLAAADDYGRWKLRMLRENLLELSSSGLFSEAEDLSDFYGRLLLTVEFADDVEAQDLLRLLQGKSQADLSLARSIANTPYNYFQGTASPYVTQTRCRNARGPNGQMVRQCFNVQVENPRYRQSQIDAKRFAVTRNIREINEIIERMVLIRDSSGISAAERQQLDTAINNLQMESQAIFRDSRRRIRF